MRRRQFIKLLGGAAAVWPFAARAQQPAMPVVGFLRITRAEESGHLVAAFRQGLRESGYPSDKVVIELRWADGREERLPKLASELVASQVAAIAAGSLPATRAVNAATGARIQSQSPGRQYYWRELLRHSNYWQTARIIARVDSQSRDYRRSSGPNRCDISD